jgi:hypothetical protein
MLTLALTRAVRLFTVCSGRYRFGSRFARGQGLERSRRIQRHSTKKIRISGRGANRSLDRLSFTNKRFGGEGGRN